MVQECSERLIARRRLLRVVTSLALAWTGSATAAWQVEPSIALEGRYDDNPRMVQGGGDDTFASTLSAALELANVDEVRSTRGLLRLDAINYSGSDERLRDRNNQVGRLQHLRKGERSRWGFDASYRRDSLIRTAEVAFDPDDVQIEPDDDVDDALIQASVRRERLVFRPFIERNLSERHLLRGEYRYNDASYDDPPDLVVPLHDYTEHRLSLTNFYNVSEINTISATLEASNYSRQDSGDYDTYSLRTGYSHRFTELTSAGFQVGVSRAEFEFDGVKDEETAMVFDLSATKRASLTRYDARVSRRLYPSGSGHVVETNELVFNLNRRMTELSTLRVRSRIYEYEALADDQPESNRRYLNVDAGIVRRMSQWWTLEGGYRYRRQKRDTDADSADSHAVFFSVKYTRPTAVADLFF